MATRQVVQMAVASSETATDALYVACSDGTLWRLGRADYAGELPAPTWVQLPPIPTEKQVPVRELAEGEEW